MSNPRNIGIIAAVVALAIGIWLILGRGTATPPGSRRLFTLNSPEEIVIAWLDDHTAFVNDEKGDFTVDTRTGARAIPAGITRAIKEHPELRPVPHIGPPSLSYGNPWYVSPDRRWAVADVALGKPSTEWIATRLDGTAVAAGPGVDSPAWWLPDNSGWIAIDQDKSGSYSSCIDVYKIAGPTITQTTLIPSCDIIPGGAEFAMTAPDEMLMLFDINHTEGDHTSRFKLSPGNADFLTDYGAPDAGTISVDAASLSPDGNHIVWTCSDLASMTVSFMKHPNDGDPPWNSSIDITTANNKNHRNLIPVSAGRYRNPVWMTDSRHVSVIHNNAVWSIPTT